MMPKIKQDKLRERYQADMAEEMKRKTWIRVYSQFRPLVLWYHGRVPNEIDSYHEVARTVGLINVNGGEIVQCEKLGKHWLLTRGEK